MSYDIRQGDAPEPPKPRFTDLMGTAMADADEAAEQYLIEQENNDSVSL